MTEETRTDWKSMRRDLGKIYSRIENEINDCFAYGEELNSRFVKSRARIEVPIFTHIPVGNSCLERFGEDCPETEEKHRRRCEIMSMQSAKLTEIMKREGLREYKPRVLYSDELDNYYGEEGGQIGVVRRFGLDPSRYQVARETGAVRERN